MHYVLLAMIVAVYVVALTFALDGRFGMALGLSIFASCTYWIERQRARLR